jgi:hypothetical protein
MSLSARAKMIELADNNFDLPERSPNNETPQQIDPKLKEALFPLEINPKTELDKIFGKKGDN